MLQNTRGRTVFAFQPKRLPKDVDRLTFFSGSIVRKKSLGPGGADAEDHEDVQKADAEKFEPPQRCPVGPSRSASVNDLRSRVSQLREPAAGQAKVEPQRPRPLSARLGEAPPPLPAFPGSWKSEDSRLRVASHTGGKPDDVAQACTSSSSAMEPGLVMAAGKAVLHAAMQDTGLPPNRATMQRSPSLPLPKRPTAPREKRRPRPRTAVGDEVVEAAAGVGESDGSPTSGGSSQATAAAVSPARHAQVGLGAGLAGLPGDGKTPVRMLTGRGAVAQSTPQLAVASRSALPPPIPGMKKGEGASSAILLAAASAQASLLSPVPSARRPSKSEATNTPCTRQDNGMSGSGAQ